MALITSLISWWSLDEASGNAIDAHGDRDLTDVNTVGSAAGKVGNSREFVAASSERFTHADHADLSFGNEDFTIAGWAYLASVGTDQWFLSKWISGSASRSYIVAWRNGTGWTFYVSSDGADTIGPATDTTSTSVNTWYFFVAIHDSVNNELRISINDNTPTTFSHSGGVFDGTADFVLGEAFGSYFGGRLDEVAMWRRALTSAEITELYNSGSGRAYSYLTAPPAQGYPILQPRGNSGGRLYRPFAFQPGIPR